MTETLKLYLAGGIVAVVVALIGWLGLSRAHLQTEIAALRGDYALCTSANVEWAARTAHANGAVERLRTESEERLALSEKQLKSAQEQSQKSLNRAQVFLRRPATGDSCADVRQMVEDYVKEVRQ